MLRAEGIYGVEIDGRRAEATINVLRYRVPAALLPVSVALLTGIIGDIDKK